MTDRPTALEAAQRIVDNWDSENVTGPQFHQYMALMVTTEDVVLIARAYLALAGSASQPSPAFQHSDTCGFALYGPPALCTCRASQPSRDEVLEEAAKVVEAECINQQMRSSGPTSHTVLVLRDLYKAIRALKSPAAKVTP